MACPEPATVICALKTLTTATSMKDSSTPGNQLSRLDQLLQNNTEVFDRHLDTDATLKSLQKWWIQDTVIVVSPNDTPKWKFVTYCLKTLHLLQRSLKESAEEYKKKGHKPVTPSAAPIMSPDTLGFNNVKVIKTALQFVVCLGICPYLQKGVGIPLELRSGFSDMVAGSEENDTISETEKCENLFLCLKVLISCVFNAALGTTVLTQHLTDILAGLLQLIHSMKYKIVSKSDPKVKTAANDSQEDKKAPFKDMTPASVVDLMIANAGTELKVTSSNSNICTQGDVSKCADNRTGNGETKETERNTTDETGGACELVHKDLKQEGTTGNRKRIPDVDVEYCERVLDDLVQKVYPPLLVKTLLLLQGGPRAKPSPNKSVLPPAPGWLRNVCGQQLTGIVVRPQGVLSLLRGMLDVPGAARGLTAAADWRKCDAVAKVIAHCPQQSHSVETYYQKVAPQILELLHIQDKQLGREFLRVACSTVSNMAAKHLALAHTYIICPLLSPLLACVEDRDLPDTEGDVVSEASLSVSVEDCHKVFVCGVPDYPGLITNIQPIVLVLHRLFVYTKSGVSALRAAVQEILVAFLKESDLPVSLTCLQLMTFDHSQSELVKEFPRMHPGLTFAHGPTGGVKAVKVLESDTDNSRDASVECVVSLLKDLQKFEVSGEFVVYMLNELTTFIQAETLTESEAFSAQSATNPTDSQALLDIEQQNQSRVEQFYRKLMLLNVLATVCEELGPSCIRSAKQTLEFVKATLERGVQVCKATEDVMFEAFEGETLTMAMGLLTAVLTGAFELTEMDRKQMEELLPLLLEISENHRDASVQEMATDIRIAIATHGAVWSEVTKSRGKDFSKMSKKIKKEKEKIGKTKHRTDDTKRPQIEVIKTSTIEVHNNAHETKEFDKNKTDTAGANVQAPTRDLQERVSNIVVSEPSDQGLHENVSLEDTVNMLQELDKDPKTSTCEGINEATGTTTELDIAFKELCDPLIPVRGHGLIRLAKLVKNRDPSIMGKREAVLKIFEENLDHPDSYLYLSAVNGLSALCDVNPGLVLPRICEQFSNTGSGDGRKRSAELRLKLGEIIVKATRGLGETVPQYRDLLITTVLIGARDEEPFVRASSLSNLGDICKLLRFALGNVVHEVFSCCSGLLRSDGDVQVRKAAGQALVLLLQGMGQDVFKILDSVLKDLYRLLKQAMLSEPDDGVKVHVGLALDELDIIMRAHLFPEQKLEKKIRVLSVD